MSRLAEMLLPLQWISVYTASVLWIMWEIKEFCYHHQIFISQSGGGGGGLQVGLGGIGL